MLSNLKKLKTESGFNTGGVFDKLDKGRDGELINTLMRDKLFTREYVGDQHGVTPEHIDALYKYARCEYESGLYSAAGKHLLYCSRLAANETQRMHSLWGRYASHLLVQEWDDATEAFRELKEAIDGQPPSVKPAELLQQRTWFIHWSLFLFFNAPNGKSLMIDTLFEVRYIQTIQTNCPWILRYLATVVICSNKRGRQRLQELVRMLQQERYCYSDPITLFLESLYLEFDFEGAQKKLKECDTVLNQDFFLACCSEDFKENARVFIFEFYCRIHQTIQLSDLSEKLDMDIPSAEKWIVDLIRDARLNAKIDTAAKTIVMGSQVPSIYQQVMAKTESLAARTYDMSGRTVKASSK